MNDRGDARRPAPASAKILYVETLRGIACILLVSYHVIGDTSSNGLRLPDGDLFSFVNRMFIDVRMPLFSFISGFVFSAYAADLPALRGKVGAKVRRLLVPMVVVGSLHYGLQTVFAPQGDAQVPYYYLFILPYEHFWYLQATFLLMLTVFVVTYALKGDGTRAAAVLLLPCILVSVLLDRWHPDVFSSYKAVYLAPYFLTGYLISHAARLKAGMDRAAASKPLVAAASVLFILLFVLEWALVANLVHPGAPERRAIGLGVGLSACLFLFLLRFQWRFLTFIGDKSYAIYLFHVLFTAGSRIVLERLVPGLGVPALFAVGVVAGLTGPIVVSWLALKHPVSSLLFLGIRTAPRRRAKQEPAFGN
ncbi:MAG TPA: acyltransferase [Dongiaceae bacterium]|nr:acyltransferase [Dongiaceae bacterium]